jgi:multidrug resistance efflux pump
MAMVTFAILWQKRLPQAAASRKIGAIRTATVSSGPVINTLRLTGVTAAEHFASLVTPQLRFSRADKSRESPSGSSKGPAMIPATASSAANEFSLVLRHAVKPGSQVETGQVVAEFDRQYMLNRVEDYRAVVTQTEADFKKQKAELEAVRKAHDQAVQGAKIAVDKARLELQKMPVQSAMDAERTKLAFEEAEARSQQLVKEDKFLKVSQDASIRKSELAFEQAKLELSRAEVDANVMTVRSPMAGTAVMQSMFRNGELAPIQEGDQLWSGVLYLQVVDPSSMVVNASVNQVDVEKLRLGQRATVRLDAYPGLELPAHVISIAAGTKPAGGRVSFVKEVPVRLKIDQKDPRVIPDLSISADVALASDDRPAAVAPAGAVFREGARAQAYVFVQGASGWERRDVELGLTNHLQASIRSGLKPGEVIALDRPKEPQAP